MTITHGSLFSGIGGFDLGFERVGIPTLWSCEIDPHARQVLRRHWPDLTIYEDVTAINGASIAPVDVLSFGSPCQDLSVAGRRGGLDGERSGLFHEATRIIKVVTTSGWTELDSVGKVISDSHRYRMTGNAVAVPVIEWIARNIHAVLS